MMYLSSELFFKYFSFWNIYFRYDTSENDNYSQCGIFWRKVLSEDAKQRLIENMSMHLVNAAEFIQDRAVEMFSKCDEDYGKRLQQALIKLRKIVDTVIDIFTFLGHFHDILIKLIFLLVMTKGQGSNTSNDSKNQWTLKDKIFRLDSLI